MKKAYEAPMVEKIAFNYRDQVVAASGAPSGLQGDGFSAGEQIIHQFAQGFGVPGCAGYECNSWANWNG